MSLPASICPLGKGVREELGAGSHLHRSCALCWRPLCQGKTGKNPAGKDLGLPFKHGKILGYDQILTGISFCSSRSREWAHGFLLEHPESRSSKSWEFSASRNPQDHPIPEINEGKVRISGIYPSWYPSGRATTGTVLIPSFPEEQEIPHPWKNPRPGFGASWDLEWNLPPKPFQGFHEMRENQEREIWKQCWRLFPGNPFLREFWILGITRIKPPALPKYSLQSSFPHPNFAFLKFRSAPPIPRIPFPSCDYFLGSSALFQSEFSARNEVGEPLGRVKNLGKVGVYSW